MYPVTAAGKFITAVISLIGIGFIAIPGGMFASEFMSALAKEKEENNNKNEVKCLKCGSTEIQNYAHPVVEYGAQKQSYDNVYVCSKCDFTWMGKPNVEIN